MTIKRTILAGGAVALFALAGCGGDDSSAASTSSSTTSTTSATTGTGSSSVTKVDANTASQAELTAALEAAGVSNASRWAREVAEYRPYSGTDDWAHLKQELSKYNIDSDTLSRILSALEV